MSLVSIHGRSLQWDPVARDFVSDGQRLGRGSVPVKGRDFFVDDAVNRSSGVSPDEAVGTLDEAFALIGTSYPNMGSRIYVMPDHEETITGVGGITHDIAGVSVIGLGHGAQRPRFLMDGATTVTYVISAADACVRNLVFAAGHADIVTCFNITAKGAWIDGCEFVENTTAENFLTPIKATSTVNNNADGLKVTNCRWFGVDAAALEFVEGNADINALVIEDNFVCIEGTASPLLLMATGKDITYASIQRNRISHKMTANELLVNIDTSANSGIIADNDVGHADVTGAHDLGIDALGCRLFRNYSVSTDALSGVLLPAADVDL